MEEVWIRHYSGFGITPGYLLTYRLAFMYSLGNWHNAFKSMLEFRTQGFNGYAVKYSPFFDSRIAVAASANFGLVGNGRLYILGLTPKGIVAEKWYATRSSSRSTSNLKTYFSKLGSILKIPSMTFHGRNPTRAKSSSLPAMALSNSSILV